MKRHAEHGLGGLLLALLAIHAGLKIQEGQWPELLWASHVTAAVLAVGLIAQWKAWSALGFLFHLGVAAPAYALHLLAGGDTNWTSLALHVLSPVAGWYAWRGVALPAPTWWRGWLVYLLLVLVCRAFTPEPLNVNLAFKPWEASPLLGLWANRIANALLVLGQLAGAQWGVNRYGSRVR